MKKWAESFYKSYAWQQTRDAYLKSQGGLCELCRQKGLIVPAVIVHHKRHLTAQNITDPHITLSADNLCAVCRECHEKLHHPNQAPKRYKIDADGHVIIV